MKLKEIHRTSTFAWSTFQSLPLLATGTVAGALDESFSNESQLEIWAPDYLNRDEFYLGADSQHGPKGLVKDTARFVYFTLVAISGADIMNYIDLIVWHGDMSMEIAHKGLSQLVSRMVSWRCGILQRFWRAQGMSWRILIDITHKTNHGPFCSTSQSLILRNTTHTGPVRGLDFNPIQTNLLASGAINGEVRIDNCQFPIDI